MKNDTRYLCVYGGVDVKTVYVSRWGSGNGMGVCLYVGLGTVCVCGAGEDGTVCTGGAGGSGGSSRH